MNINKAKITKIRQFLKKHKNFLISAHIGPEGDSLGAQLAFARVIRGMGKNCDIVNSDHYSKEYAFLPGINKIITRARIKKYDAAVILDCTDITRIGNVVNLLDKNIPVLNIDHHVSNTYFGDINLVNASASSVCEVLYSLFKELNIRLDKIISLCLYAGIVTDTGLFRYTNTSAYTHLVVSHLLKWKIDASQVFRNIYQNLNLSELKLVNRVLFNIKEDATGKIAWVGVRKDMLKKYRPQIDLTDNILNFIRYIKGIEVCVLFRDRVGKEKNIRVNLRSRGRVDVNKIAQQFGGGGHRTASGATMRNISLKQAEIKVIDLIKKKIVKLK